VTPAPPTDAPVIRVLILVKTLVPGGAERLIETQLESLDRSRFRVDVAYVLDRGGDFPERIRRLCNRMIKLRRGNHRRGIGAIGLVRLVVRERYDVIHIHSPVLGSIARLVARLIPRSRRPSLVTTEHLVWDNYHPVTRFMNKITIQGDDRVFAVGSEVLASMSLRHPERAEVLIHGVDREHFRPDPVLRRETRTNLGLDDETFVIAVTAHFRRQKNHELLVRILSELDRRDVRFVCLLAGTGELENVIRRRVEKAGLGSRVRFLGLVDDTAGILVASDVFMLTSLWEGLPVALMEALACGCPVVASDVDGIHDTLVDSGAGYLFDPRVADVTSVCDVLALVASDAELRQRMSREATVIAAGFDAARSVNAVAAAYEQLVAGRRTTRS